MLLFSNCACLVSVFPKVFGVETAVLLPRHVSYLLTHTRHCAVLTEHPIHALPCCLLPVYIHDDALEFLGVVGGWVKLHFGEVVVN